MMDKKYVYRVLFSKGEFICHRYRVTKEEDTLYNDSVVSYVLEDTGNWGNTLEDKIKSGAVVGRRVIVGGKHAEYELTEEAAFLNYKNREAKRLRLLKKQVQQIELALGQLEGNWENVVSDEGYKKLWK